MGAAPNVDEARIYAAMVSHLDSTGIMGGRPAIVSHVLTAAPQLFPIPDWSDRRSYEALFSREIDEAARSVASIRLCVPALDSLAPCTAEPDEPLVVVTGVDWTDREAPRSSLILIELFASGRFVDQCAVMYGYTFARRNGSWEVRTFSLLGTEHGSGVRESVR